VVTAFTPFPLFLYDSRQTQQLGADAELFLPSGIDVDFETNLAIFQPEVDDSPIMSEPFGFADG
jgi:hypothetical protein